MLHNLLKSVKNLDQMDISIAKKVIRLLLKLYQTTHAKVNNYFIKFDCNFE